MRTAGMFVLLASLAFARDIVVVGERAAPASYQGWPGVLRTCLDAARPGALAVIDYTSLHPSVATTRRVIEGARADAIMILALTPPQALGAVGRVGWRHALPSLLRAAVARSGDVLLFGPWPAARTRVRAAGAVPESAIGITVDDPYWAAAGEVAAEAGVRQVSWQGADARAAAALLPPEPPKARGAFPTASDAWADLPRTDAWSLGRLACGAVLKAEISD